MEARASENDRPARTSAYEPALCLLFYPDRCPRLDHRLTSTPRRHHCNYTAGQKTSPGAYQHSRGLGLEAPIGSGIDAPARTGAYEHARGPLPPRPGAPGRLLGQASMHRRVRARTSTHRDPFPPGPAHPNQPPTNQPAPKLLRQPHSRTDQSVLARSTRW